MNREADKLARELLKKYDSRGLGIESNVDRLLRFSSQVSGIPIEEVTGYYNKLREVASEKENTGRYGSLTLAAMTVAFAIEMRTHSIAMYFGEHGTLPINDEDLE